MTGPKVSAFLGGKLSLLRLAADRAGNFALTAALATPVLLGAIGAALDYGQLLADQQRLQDALDGAAVAGASSMVSGKHDETTVKLYAANFVMAELNTTLSTAEQIDLKTKLNVAVTTTKSGGTSTFSIKVTGGYTEQLSPFSRFIGYGQMPISASSLVQSQSQTKNAMSMYVVLDRSGSMSFVTDTILSNSTKCQNYTEDNWGSYPNLTSTKPCYVNKMGALKKAAASLADQLDDLEDKDKSDQIVRMGGVSFNDAMQTPQGLGWGTTSVRSYVNNLPDYPTGGTNMTSGMEQAYNALMAATEATAQTGKGNTTFSKFIVLMTDGKNTGNSSNWNPALDTLTLTTCAKARVSGITIYTVAFMAPTEGENLLKACAGVGGNYYAAKDMNSLIAAFADIGNKATRQATRIVN